MGRLIRDQIKSVMTLVISLLLVAVIVLPANMGVYAAARVVCDVEVLTDTDARISLRWSDGKANTGIMITSWRFERNGLVVYYQTGNNVPQGYSDRKVKVENSKYTFPMRVVLEPSTGHVPEFTDIVSGDLAYDSVVNLYYQGIIGGYPDGSFKPDNKVTRAEFSKMLLLTADYEVDESSATIFSDVDQGFWGRSYIMTLANKEIVKGKGQGRFDPNGQITIGEVLTVLSRTFNLYNKGQAYPYTLKSHWSNEYFEDVVEQGLVVSSDAYYEPYTPDAKATRQECAILLSRLLENLHDVAK